MILTTLLLSTIKQWFLMKRQSNWPKLLLIWVKHRWKAFGINDLLKQKYHSLKQFWKTISHFRDIWSMAKVVISKTQSWHQRYPIFIQFINIELSSDEIIWVWDFWNCSINITEKLAIVVWYKVWHYKKTCN